MSNLIEALSAAEYDISQYGNGAHFWEDLSFTYPRISEFY
jgi:hypothetical protein